MMSAALSWSGETTPPAASTWSSFWTLVSKAAGIFADPVVVPLTISLPLMTASVSSSVAVKSPSKDFCIVSVRM
jgi:hypothetical protein